MAATIGQSDYGPLDGAIAGFVGLGYHRLDFSLLKNFKTSENTSLQFRAEFFNITNHPNFGLPNDNTIDVPNDPRQIQFALKFYF